jgi:glucose/arabinose dehydrogenase
MKRATGLVLFLTLYAVSSVADEIVLKPVVTGLLNPVALTHAGDARLFITLQGGRIMIFDGGLRSQPFLDVSSLVSCCGERGLLSVAFHPDYRDNGLFFVDYTNTSGDTVIARYRVSPADVNRADPASAAILLTIQQPFANHNGGQLQFGPDGYLYIGMGDGGSAGDPGNRAQNLNELLGKILRIDVNSGSTYAVPATNPFAGRTDARGEIWAYGVRNPWRFSFDRGTGDLWIGDVGQDAFEEIDLQRAASAGGQNYGWHRMEATHCFNPSTNCQEAALTLPILEYSHAEGCSVTGGYRYRGTASPRLQGTYFYGDFCSGTIWGASEIGSAQWTVHVFARTAMGITSFGEDVKGELYVIDYNTGTIHEITDPRPTPQRRRAAGH